MMRGWIVSSVAIAAAVTRLAFGANAADGDFVWATAVGTEQGGGLGGAVATDSAGNVYTTGYFSGTVDFDPGPGIFNLTSKGQSDIFATKLDGAGNFVWAKAIGASGADVGQSIAVDNAGNVYVSGLFGLTVDFDPGPGVFYLTSESASGFLDIFVLKLDRSGDFVWAKRMRGSKEIRWSYIAVDGAGNVYTTGTFQGTVDFNPGAEAFDLTSMGADDIFVSKLDSAGHFLWAKRMGGGLLDYGRGIAVDSAGNVYTTGLFEDTVDFDPGPGVFNLTSAGNWAIFVSKLDSAGNFIWAKQMGGMGQSSGLGIAVDNAGNVYTVGSFEDAGDFDPGPGTFNLGEPGVYSAFVSKLDSAGDFVWAKQTSFARGEALAVDSAGNVYVTGHFDQTVDFDPGPGTFNLATVAGNAIFLSKLDSAGNFIWAKAIDSVHFDGMRNVAVDGDGNAYTTGGFYGTWDFDPGPGIFNLSSPGSFTVFVLKLSGPPDTTPPNATAITPWPTGPTSAAHIPFTVVFNEPVQGFDDATDVLVNFTGNAASTGVSIAGSGAVYTVTVTGISGTGTLSLAVNTASDVEDLAGNPIETSVTSPEVILDPNAVGLPLAVWPLGLVLLAAGTVAMALRRIGGK